ncbi:MAG: GntR family transcriptional regulator [Synergistaceae bacterium]|nr:GntR family transcriptional regulator [Synergistaceae bacterium]
MLRVDEKMKETRTSRERIYEELKTEIFDGRLRPSNVLVVDDLARRFGVSRTPVREALIALSNKGLLDARYHVGFIVTSVNVREIIETYHLRSILEKEAVRLAVRNVLPDDLRQLKESAFDLGRRFHSLIPKASGWDVLAETLENLMDKSERVRSLFMKAPKYPPEKPDSNYGHQKIYTAIAAGDEEEATIFMEKHLEESREYILKIVSPSFENNDSR